MKYKAVKITLVAIAILLLLLSLSVVVYWGITGVTSFDEGLQQLSTLLLPRENDVYRKSSYSVSDKKAVKLCDQVIGKAADAELTNGLLQIYYWMDVFEYLENYSYYAVYNGLDYTQPLDQQTCREIDGTWQQFFLDRAIQNWYNYRSLSMMAAEEGFELPEAYQTQLDELRGTLTEAVLSSDFNTIDEMLQAELGAGCDYEDYYRYMESFYWGHAYINDRLDQFQVTDQMIQDYYDSNVEQLQKDGISKDSGDVKDVRHILIGVRSDVEDEDGETVYSEEDWQTCKEQAQKVLDEWLAGEATEESFAALAYQYSEDSGSNENGGLYENLDAQSGFVPEFIDWYMDESRQPGDYELIRTDYGYHLMYFVESEPQWLRTCRTGVVSDRTTAILQEAAERFPMDVEYKKIALAVVDLEQSEV